MVDNITNRTQSTLVNLKLQNIGTTMEIKVWVRDRQNMWQC